MNKKKSLIKGPYVSHRSEMYKSPAWRSIHSLAARQILDCLEIEHMRHAGKKNGELICTYNQLVAYGMRRMSIAPAIRLAIAVGVLKITRQGRRVAGYYRFPTWYALTYLPIGNSPPTDEWRNYRPQRLCNFDTATGSAAKAAEKSAKPSKLRERKRYRSPVAETIPESGSESATPAPGSENATPFYNSTHLPASEVELVEDERGSESLEACTETPAAPIENGKPKSRRRKARKAIKLHWHTPVIEEVFDRERHG